MLFTVCIIDYVVKKKRYHPAVYTIGYTYSIYCVCVCVYTDTLYSKSQLLVCL